MWTWTWGLSWPNKPWVVSRANLGYTSWFVWRSHTWEFCNNLSFAYQCSIWGRSKPAVVMNPLIHCWSFICNSLHIIIHSNNICRFYMEWPGREIKNIIVFKAIINRRLTLEVDNGTKQSSIWFPQCPTRCLSKAYESDMSKVAFSCPCPPVHCL